MTEAMEEVVGDSRSDKQLSAQSSPIAKILSNLVLGDNEIRASNEKAVNERLAHTPELYLALAQFAITADIEVLEMLICVSLDAVFLLRCPSPPRLPPCPNLYIPTDLHDPYDHLSAQAYSTLERLLLWSLTHEAAPDVRHKTMDTVTDLVQPGLGFRRAPAAADGAARAAAQEREFSVQGVTELQIDPVLGVLQCSLKDKESIDVRHAALLLAMLAFVNSLSTADATQLVQSISLLSPVLDMLADLSNFLIRRRLLNGLCVYDVKSCGSLSNGDVGELGGEFETYLPMMMPSLLTTAASAKTDLSVSVIPLADDEDPYGEREGWETIALDVRTL
ncbi:hypothetical protein BJ912DRAFT_1047808 [Pholiota molesta]|nr:hypothetical protein BJ912DRAFT_1047808 [Pholiota molesta]